MSSGTDVIFEPKDCPIGIVNGKEIEHLGDRVDMAIERLTEKVGELREDITSLSENMDQKFKSVDKRFDTMDEKIEKLKESIPATIDDQLDRKKGNTAASAIKWVFCGMGGSVLIALITAWLKMKLGF